MFVNRLKWIVSCFFVALFCCSLMFLPGCNLFGPGGSESVSALLETTQVTTGDANLKFNVVLPEPSVRASTSDCIRASGQSVTVTFSINLIDTSTGNSWVVRQTVSVDDNGQANASFNSLPSVTVVGEINIEGGHRGGFNEFHGAVDLKTGDNTIDVSPKGSGTLADITAKILVQVKNSPNLIRNSPRDLATAIKNSAEQVGTTDNSLEKEKEALNNFISTNVNQAAYVKLAIDNNNLNATGKSTWQKSLSELVTNIDYPDANWQLKEIVSQGFGASAYVAIKSLDGSKFGLLKINSENGNLLNWLINEGNCDPVMVLADDSVVVGGTLGGKPLVFRWNGAANQTLTATSHAINQWATAIDVDGTAAVPDPGVENFFLGTGDRLTCKLTDPQTGYPVTVVIDNNSGSIISTDRIPAPRVWAEGLPNAISIGWDLHAAAKSYNLYFAPADAELSQASHSGKFTSVVPLYTHKDLPPDTTYNYLVTWIDADGAEHDYSAFAKATSQAPRSIVGKWREEGLPRHEESDGKRYTTTKNYMFKNDDGTYSELVEMLVSNIGEDNPYLTLSFYSEGVYEVIENRIERHVTYIEQTATITGGNPSVEKSYINIETGEIQVYDAGGKESGNLLRTETTSTAPGVFTFTYENGVLETVGATSTTRYVVLPEPQVQNANVVGKWREEGLPSYEERDGKKIATTKHHMIKNADGTYSELVEMLVSNIGEDNPYLTASFYSEGIYEVIEDRIERHLTYLEQTTTPTGGETSVEKSYINIETGEVKVYDAGGKESGNLLRTETVSTEPGVFTFTRDVGVLTTVGSVSTTRYVAFSDSQVHLVNILLSKNVASIATDESYDLAGIQVTANFSDGSTKTVTDVNWAVKSGAGTVSGKVFTAPAQIDTTVLECSYTEFDATKTAEFAITITGEINSDFAGGDGSEANPYQITTWVHLNNVRNYLDKHFVLKNDLSSQTEGYNDYAAATANEGKGWSPIGTSTNAFAGSFDGAANKIIDLNIARGDEYGVGLFAFLQNAVIKSLTLENVKIEGGTAVGGVAGVADEAEINDCKVDGVLSDNSEHVGGIAGRLINNATVNNCSNTASINGYYTAGGIAGLCSGGAQISNSSNSGIIFATSNLGGIAGSNGGIIGSCYNTGKVSNTSGGDHAGGIAGWNSGKINGCYSNAEIYIQGYWDTRTEEFDYAGGIAGINTGEIAKSFSMGTITSYRYGYAGGIVGANFKFSVDPLISQCYSSAKISGGNGAGGLVAENQGTIDQSFWDVDATEQSTSAGDGTGKTTSQMTSQATFTGWSFAADNWAILEGQSYPYLAWQNGANIPYASANNSPALTTIGLSETSASLLINATYNLADIQVTANFSDSSSKTVTDVSWVVKSGAGTISEKVFTAPAQAGTTVLECSYTESDVTKTAELAINTAEPNGILRGTVKDAVNDSSLSGVSVKAYDGETLVDSALTGSDGSFSLDLPGGIYYRIVMTKADYRDVTYSNQLVEPSATVYLESVLQIAVQYSGTGSVNGTITDALTGQGLEGVLVELRAGVNAQTGEVVTSTTTSSSGYYSFSDLETGNYTAQVSKTGYVNSFYSVTCVGGETRDNQNHSISPVMAGDEWRVVLTWGAEPYDLDSHMTGPDDNSERFHVYFSNRQYADSLTEVDLDVDDMSSYGPETITIRKQTSGVYRYSVHDYSNNSSSDSNKLSLSGASVKLYKGGELVKTFNVPSGAGTLWTVFELNGNSLTSVNSMSFVAGGYSVTSIRANAAASELHLFRNLPAK